MMTETNGGHIVNPNEGDGSTSDPNWHGDMGDQGNDIRFAEEQALINDQAEPVDDDDAQGAAGASEAAEAAEQEGHYTSAQPAGGAGGYTSSQNPVEEGEYTDKDKPVVDVPEGEGEYTDREQ